MTVLSQKQSNFNDWQQTKNNMDVEIKQLHQQIKALKQRQSEILIRLNHRNDQIQQYEKIIKRKEKNFGKRAFKRLTKTCPFDTMHLA